MRWLKKKIRSHDRLTPDEVFLDAHEIPGFSRERLEGLIEKPIGKGAFFSFGALLGLFGLLLVGRTFWLQVVRGEELTGRSENNYIETEYIDPPRGVIYDRTGEIIATNEAYTDEKGEIRYRRAMRHPYAFSHLVGYVGIPSQAEKDAGRDAIGVSAIGKTGLESRYDTKLRGIAGRRDQELDAAGAIISRGLIVQPEEGENIKTTINAPLQEALWEVLDRTMHERGFRGGGGLIFSVKDGSVAALVSVPSYDANAFARGLTQEEASALFSDKQSPLFNRVLSGTYAPGSIIKPFVALAALEEGVIDEHKSIYSSGVLELPNPFNPSQPSRFLDWKAHGYVDLRRAIAVSSDVYFYTIGGGNGDVKGLGIARIKSWLEKFGFGKMTGIDLDGEKVGFLPDPESKKTLHPENPIWRIGDTYHASIGQGDVLMNPLEVARALGALATGGTFTNLHIAENAEGSAEQFEKLSFNPKNLKAVHEGMRSAVADGGTAAAVSWVETPIAGKTGTAEVGGKKDRVHSWFIGFAPADDPQIGVVLFLESGPRSNLVGAPFVTSELFRWITAHGGVEGILR
ncbi:MAG: penicillin-binding transpeptidase domain-containing protein [Patescibacteria group bacterium]